MRDNLGKITNILQWVLFAVTIVFVIFYFLNLDVIEEGIDTTWASRMLKYGYVLVAIAAAGAVLGAIVNFALRLTSEPKKALFSLIPIIVLGVLLLIANVMASPELLDMPNYTGTDNEPGTLKIVGTGLYMMYFLLGLAIVAAVVSEVSKVFK
jgi:hypothetical protein